MSLEKVNTSVSIIVPVYGTEAYLSACIESLRKQTYENIQIILVDDQSPDRCPEICDDYAKKDSRIIVIHQKNTGVSGARNKGLAHATGDYVMFVDSDDELYPNAVEILLDDILGHDADIVSALKATADGNGRFNSPREDYLTFVYRGDEALILSLDGDQNTNSACAKLFKASFIRDCFFEERKHIHEDGFFIFQCYLKKPMLVQHNVTVYRYNFVENSNSKQRFSDKYFAMLYFCNRKKEIVAQRCPHYTEKVYNMEVRTHLQFLDVLCRTDDERYKDTYKESVKTVKKRYQYHKPINSHHKKLAWIVAKGMYPLYRKVIRFKYYR